ncbi:NAD-dependent epimerase/dehydratase family protein [Rouxiella badensis]|jgi:nucleoside-diphosphate-sugar epimerase|uniref:NAD-dependent epimerase/dehydratase domain-containing protein n=1 Tax=Rouxiella badensis TaxID=1646377 RepID=A0A1X0WDV2_9GAMM|nr:NAD(P)-dependent oxidoreductase [Rouxiella badensis]MCC3701096.1 NAD(P)-dependent oxidoreductase [Rouxiella badensis]MCC3717523.1 NAD(P)-dependent oxidoreductase [Rouxiella badensis]MCC3727533.1 NAD(P)-dependent oxidoreductase [Rouxiella badensis]MCC3732522.1 NAD(P)-dependent oxidoreductase [Rouxiella badensis]MCC3740365.1 NAD(P)-dependent oxidoreductase [Rouxiella badensis]
MKVLVTGATSGPGRNAVEYLRRKGIKVRATGRNAAMGPLLEKLGAEFIHADLTNLVSSEAKVLLADVDTLWHCSGLSAPWGSEQAFELANVRATRRLGEWAAAYGVENFIHLSSPAIYFDFHHHRNIKEDFRPARFANQFARSKAAAEQVITTLALSNPQTHFTILRPQGIFGPHDNVLLPRLLQMIKYGTLMLPRGGEALVDMTYVENVAHAMWLATESQNHESGRAYNITNMQPRPLKTIIEQLMAGLDVKYRIRTVPYPLLDMMARGMEKLGRKQHREPMLTHYSVAKLNFDVTLDTQRAETELGYHPIVSLDEGIQRTALWLRDHGKLQQKQGIISHPN